jgi:hypothetical protein
LLRSISEQFILPFLIENLQIKICKAVILLALLYERETLNLTAREHTLWMSENKMLRIIFRTERKKETGTEK